MNKTCIKHKKTCPRNLTCIPGVGPSIQQDLYSLGINKISDLENKCPEALYEQLCRQLGGHIDRCVLYVFRCAVYFASAKELEDKKLAWWYWKD